MPVLDKLWINVDRDDVESIDALSFEANHHKGVLMLVTVAVAMTVTVTMAFSLLEVILVLVFESSYINIAYSQFTVDA